MFIDDLIGWSGLSPIFAKTVIRRAAQRAGLDPDALRQSDFHLLEGELERALRVYLGDEAPTRVKAIRAKVPR